MNKIQYCIGNHPTLQIPVYLELSDKDLYDEDHLVEFCYEVDGQVMFGKDYLSKLGALAQE